MLRIAETPFSPADEIDAFLTRVEGAGGVATFIGKVRGGDASSLTLEHFPGVTEGEIAKFEAAARERFDLVDVLIVHRVGSMAPEEPIVLVATAARHRRDAFAACDFLMDYLKSEAPFWKKETTADGARWIEPRAEDREDIARWRDTRKD